MSDQIYDLPVAGRGDRGRLWAESSADQVGVLWEIQLRAIRVALRRIGCQNG